jgi:DNA-binding transcriptional ArsR family regulator
MQETKHRAIRLHRVLGNPLRAKILDALEAGPLTPGRLSRVTHRLLPAVSRALSILSLADLVENRTVGHAVLYRLKHPAILGLLRHAEAVVQRFNLPALPPIYDSMPPRDGPPGPAPDRAS